MSSDRPVSTSPLFAMRRSFGLGCLSRFPISISRHLKVILAALAVVGAVFGGQTLRASTDINRDGSVDVLDLQRIVNIISQIVVPQYAGQGDVDGSSVVDVTDLQLVVNAILGVGGPSVTVATPSSLPPATLNVAYEARLAATGGTPPYAWSYEAPLPVGLVMVSDGRVFGTPTVVSTTHVSFRVIDSLGSAATKLVTIVVDVPNQPPIAVNDSYSVLSGSTLTVPAPGVLANDTDPNNHVLSAFVASPPSVGILNLAITGAFTYTPQVPNGTTDTFTYMVMDSLGAFAFGTVTIMIGNSPPTARDDGYTTEVEAGLIVSAPGLLANDTDPNNQPLTATLAGGPVFGTVQVNGDGSFVYTPSIGFEGIDRFSYEVSDPLGASSHATAYIRVGPPLTGNSFAVLHTEVAPNPVKAGDPVTIRAIIMDPSSMLPASNNVASVTVPGTAFGATGSITLALSATLSNTVGVYSATATIPGAATYGIHETSVTATNLVNHTTHRALVFAVYTGSVVRVGPTRQITLVGQGCAAALNGDAVLIDPGTYTGIGNRAMIFAREAIIAGAAGDLRTVIDAQGADGIFQSAGPNRNSILMGLTLQNASLGAIRTANPLSIVQCVIRDNTNDTDGGAITAEAGSDLNIIQCAFVDNTIGDMLGTASLRGGAIAIANGRIESRHSAYVGNTSFNRAFSHGGAVYFSAGSLPVSTFTNSLFVRNVCTGGQWAYGGAVSGILATQAQFTTGLFRLNAAIGPGAPAVVGGDFPMQAVTNSRAAGGAVFGGDTMAQFAFAACDFDRNSCQGTFGAAGGAVSIRNQSVTSFNTCNFTGNWCEQLGQITNTNIVFEGGAIEINNRTTSTFRFCNFTDNRVEGTITSRGGAVLFLSTGIGELFACTFQGNSARTRGGAICAESYAAVVLDQCDLSDNIAGSTTAPASNFGIGGGALYLGNTSGAHVEHTSFIDNTGLAPSSSTGGGGAVLYGSMSLSSAVVPTPVQVNFHNCLFTGNSGSPFGGVVAKYADQNVTPRVVPLVFTSCTAVNNTATNTGGFAAMSSSVHSLTINSSILWNNTPTQFLPSPPQLTCNHSNVGPLAASTITYSGTTGNINANPIFAVGPRGDFYLTHPNSPCIDAGSQTLALNPTSGLTTNVTGTPDIGVIDMGYHYFDSQWQVVPVGTASINAFWVAAASNNGSLPPPAAIPFLPLP